MKQNKSIDLVVMPDCDHEVCDAAAHEGASEIYYSGELCCTDDNCRCEPIVFECLQTNNNTQEGNMYHHPLQSEIDKIMNALSKEETKSFCAWTQQTNKSYAEASLEWATAKVRNSIRDACEKLSLAELLVLQLQASVAILETEAEVVE